MPSDRKGPLRKRHLAGFVFSGLLAFAIDALVLFALTHWLGVSPFIARVPAILLSMVAGWISNRSVTFHVATGPRLAEFLRYAAASGFGVGVNYAVFSAVLILQPSAPPVAALVIASAVAAGVSYVGYRWFAFAR
ncbi:GtrA family protein [Jiella sp. M17.18]|uniref:GtrA family protein n=1 Tax=Jiella sp. M17.18 TaxID=3234247 RepID=UPI0034DE0D52